MAIVKNLLIKLGVIGTGKATKELGGVEKSLKGLGKQALATGAAFFGGRAIIAGLRLSLIHI